ncbi:c-type cytochrome [Niabella beijingensis]|uniref:c-type cytochrome n=1 Tax=Niabella beijingensis TaxID=2872700 RepID=UPI001CBEE5A4|nr:cytochrome c [Niabella beijingensis]MBZ4192608.1 cytochrome c [Niabella beijingensis]
MRKIFTLGLFIISFNGYSQVAKKPIARRPVVHKPVAQVSETTLSIRRGKLVYQKFCLSCHQPDGGGVPNLNPPLVGTSNILGKKSRLVKIVKNGLQEHVEIDGEYYSNNMPPFKMLTDQQIADVLTYIRKSFGNNAAAVLKSEVTQYYAKGKK